MKKILCLPIVLFVGMSTLVFAETKKTDKKIDKMKKKATFVLVHGAWYGGWCWKKVTPRLTSAGHAVYTQTLTGLGERRHLLSVLFSSIEEHLSPIALYLNIAVCIIFFNRDSLPNIS
jgi:hypothetical protein